MRDTNLLQLALGLTPPWTVTRSDFDPEAQRLDIEVDFAPGSRYTPTLRCRRLPGLRHPADELAPSQLLSTPGLSERSRAARSAATPCGTSRSMCHGRGQTAASHCCSRHCS